MEKLKYPIGRFEKPEQITTEHIAQGIKDISTFTPRLEKELKSLSEGQLDTPYREGGWTIRQVVHHCADSHMNSLIRFKWALTEDNPTIKAYYEDRWAELADSKTLDIAPSLEMLKGLHRRWTTLLENMSSDDLERTFIHPENNKSIPLKENILIYAWHSNHHLAHVKLISRK